MKKIIILIIVVFLGYEYIQENGVDLPNSSSLRSGNDSSIQTAYNNRQSDLQVQGEGIVTTVLPDDREGSQHQKFILKLETGQTLLIAHNIDLAPRISGLASGDTVEFYGEYEWNAKGGVIHWTHHDPNNRHIGGWLKHKGRIYQ
ncbi:DUF3465 domain-containing protein [Nitrincola iocasae]|uniref:DUF3465 domain-containing protein n=1 Tax=Nitrincola iocasae TaxID=2614693 RepID=A0A5J6LED4_9GAMM|nr:DUF3465 domain-containing protein [Nitrincola iocasae]QEW06652.1 DUF3465 domain-containing protein [Nitrincola iocasae]